MFRTMLLKRPWTASRNSSSARVSANLQPTEKLKLSTLNSCKIFRMTNPTLRTFTTAFQTQSRTSTDFNAEMGKAWPSPECENRF